MISESDCELDCSCREQRWELVDLVAMEPQGDGSVLVTLERGPQKWDGMSVRPGVRYQLRMRRDSLMVCAKVALISDDEFELRPLGGPVRSGLREVQAEVTVRGKATTAPDSGIYLTMQVLPELPEGAGLG